MPDELLIATEEFSYFVCSTNDYAIRPEFAFALFFSVLAYIISVGFPLLILITF